VKLVAITIACNWEAVWIIIFKLLNDLLDFCAAEKLSRVSKTGIVESVVPRLTVST
jgi:hypothetical protein